MDLGLGDREATHLACQFMAPNRESSFLINHPTSSSAGVTSLLSLQISNNLAVYAGYLEDLLSDTADQSIGVEFPLKSETL